MLGFNGFIYLFKIWLSFSTRYIHFSDRFVVKYFFVLTVTSAYSQA